MPQLSIVTFNLLNKPSRWEQRRVMIAGELAALQPDVIALQEVALPDNNAVWLADRLGGYNVSMCSKTGPLVNKEGIAILSRVPMRDAHSLALETQHRVVQRVQVCINDLPIVLVNGHFLFHVVDHDDRIRQVQHMLNWLGRDSRELPTIICGDFNATPGSRAIQLMCGEFQSAHHAHHGCEPEYTVPTLLKYRFSGVRRTLSRLGNVALNHSLQPWRGTVDYIFVNRHIQVIECQTVLHRPATHDRTLYPSDHIGLCATIAVP